ncbi:MAG: GSCFA domain-containing protein, partial [Saprospiraceae bacterium]|nr:GSCFA domain-containing protein [Saprospiraceae bacterium]
MEFRTQIEKKNPKTLIASRDRILSFGSCFADQMGGRLKDLGFSIVNNPNGIVFHPIPLARIVDRIIQGFPYSKSDLVLDQEFFSSFDHHGSFSNTSEEEMLGRLNDTLQQTRDELLQAQWIFITFGTAWAYHWVKSGEVVSNCHKIPQVNFKKGLTPYEDLWEAWENTMNNLLSFNPELRILVSVSPVRHIKDGLEGNMLSKSMLRLLTGKMIDRFPEVQYFPGFEIMMDDLRDYRFFKKDLIHPNEQAQDYIWKFFQDNYFLPEMAIVCSEVDKLLMAASHRPIRSSSIK